MEHYADNQEDWIVDFAAVFDKMLTNGYDLNLMDVAEYECCTRNPPSKHKKSKKGSVVECDPSAICVS